MNGRIWVGRQSMPAGRCGYISATYVHRWHCIGFHVLQPVQCIMISRYLYEDSLCNCVGPTDAQWSDCSAATLAEAPVD